MCVSPQDLKRYGATTVVRVCDITYDKTPLEKDGINVVVSLHNMYAQRTPTPQSDVLYVTRFCISGLAI